MKKILILICLLFLSCFSYAQQMRGIILDSVSQKAIAGATVHLSGNHSFTTSDGTGRFQINVRSTPDSVLVSLLGYRTYKLFLRSIPVQELNITLSPDTRALQAVTVSTGYQTLSKERSTGSFEQIDQTLFNRQVSTDVISRLDGIANSVLFDKRRGGNADFSVRGLSTITSTITQPLIVVDNFPYEGNINNINPNDVESVTILKDAAASSIWGVRAGNGVLVITTKKGRYNKPLQISATTNLTVTAKPDIYSTRAISSGDFIDVERFLFGKGYYDNLYTNNTNRPVLSPVEEILLRERNGQLTTQQASSQIDAYRQTDVRDDFQKYVYRRAFSQQHNVNISGGSDKLNYLFSAGYDRNLQNLIGNENDRITLRSESEMRITSKWKIQAGLQIAQSSTTLNSSGGYGSVLINGGRTGIYPYARLADESGQAAALEKDYRLSYVDTAGRGKLLDWKYRPLAETRNADNRSKLNDWLVKAGTSYQIFPFLQAEARFQYEKGLTSTRNYYSQDTYFTRNLINRYTQINGTTVNRVVPAGGVLDQGNNELSAYAVRGQFNLNKNIGTDHLINAILGGEVRQTRTESSSNRAYGFSNDNYTSTPVDFINRYPIYGTLASSLQIPNNNGFNGLLNRNVSVYGNASYTYKMRYVLNLSARKDQSNLFGVDANQKGTPLGSIGGSWTLSDEPFFKARAISLLRLRTTYGFSGNVNTAISALTTLRYSQPSLFNSINGLPLAIISNFPNPNLRWEKIATTNIGLDFGLFSNRMTGSVEYFNKKATDLIGLIPADLTQGAGSVLNQNSAELTTKGVDININSQNLNGSINWNTNFLFSYNKNTVTRYLNVPTSYNYYIGNGTGISPIVGQPAYNIISYRWAGLNPQNGNPRAYLNGEVSEDYTAITATARESDLVYSGSAIPQIYGALRNDLGFRQFNLSFNISYRFDYNFRRQTTSYESLYNSWTGYDDYADRWQKPGDELKTVVPSMVYPSNPLRDQIYNYSNITVEKGDHIRLQDIRLSYRIDRARNSGSPFQSISLYLYANNLGILWRANKYGLDPDYGQGFPNPKSISLGCNITL